jgi:hypothetical protein
MKNIALPQGLTPKYQIRWWHGQEMPSAGGFLKPHQEYCPTMLNTHIKSYHHALQVECKKNLMTLQGVKTISRE